MIYQFCRDVLFFVYTAIHYHAFQLIYSDSDAQYSDILPKNETRMLEYLGSHPARYRTSILEESQHEQFAHQMMESNEGLQVFVAGWFLLGMVLFMLISVYLVYWCFLGRHRMMVEDLAMSAELKYKINEERQKKTN